MFKFHDINKYNKYNNINYNIVHYINKYIFK